MTRKPATPVLTAALTVEVMAEHILTTYRAATDSELVDGTSWYARAHALARELSPDGVTIGAAVLAILSPRRSWPQNVALARVAFETAKELDSEGASTEAREATWSAFPTTGDQRGKLGRLFAGESPDAVVGGPKVRSFWQTIADPLSGGPAVIDRHAMAIALDRVVSADELKIGPADYARFVAAYGLASAVIGQAPAIVQAVTWVAWRRTRAVAFHGDI